MVLAVHGDFQFCGIDAIRKFDFEVEARAGENRRAVDRVDGLGNGLVSRQQDKEGRGSEGFDHEACTGSGSEQDAPGRQPPARQGMRPLYILSSPNDAPVTINAGNDRCARAVQPLSLLSLPSLKMSEPSPLESKPVLP